ncbi:MAG TPA: hypothetical protein VLD67_15470 [Vicinamibacterales bacterium]|nr:hypothetical protein [Vicinamibacterales bacterium]
MSTPAGATTPIDTSAFEIRVNSPDTEELSAADMRRLFPGSALTGSRLNRLHEWPRVSVVCGNQIVAVATCQKTDTELRAADVGIDGSCGCSLRVVLDMLVDALELAGLAGGCRRLILMPPSGSPDLLERRGFTAISERCAGGWLEKPLV